MTLELVKEDDVKTNKKSQDNTEKTDAEIEYIEQLEYANDKDALEHVVNEDIIPLPKNTNINNLPILEEKPGDNIDIIANLCVPIMKVNNKEIGVNDFIIYSKIREKDAKYIADKISDASKVKVTALDVIKYLERKDADFTDLVEKEKLDLEHELLDEDSTISEKIIRTDVLQTNRFLNRRLKGLEAAIEACAEAGDMKSAGTLNLKAAELDIKIKQSHGKLETPTKVKVDARTMNVMTFAKDLAKLSYTDGSMEKWVKKAKKEKVIEGDEQKTIETAWKDVSEE